MKKSVLLIAIFALVMGGCRKKDLAPAVQPVDVVVNVTFSEEFGNQAAVNATVTAKNVQTGDSKQVPTAEGGRAIFTSLAPGVYDFNVSFTLTPAQYFDLFNQTTENNVVFNGSSLNQLVNNATGLIQNIKLETGTIGNIVIKQIYYAGSHTSNGASFRDEFIEFYNNSNDTLYMDGIYFMQAFGKGNTTVASYTQADGQYDWNKSIGMPANINANVGYLYVKGLYRFPGNGTDYPVAPGKSVVVAQNAINHKTNYVRNDGQQVTIVNPDLTVDLSNATFETTHNDGYVFDITNPAVPDMIYLESTSRDMVFNSTHEAVLIFKVADNNIVTNAPAYPDPSRTTVTSTTSLYKQLPIASLQILDAVEIQKSATEQVPRKLSSALDNSFTFVPGGGYSSQSVIRKVSKTFGERKVLADTNNSSEDFTFLTKTNPFGW